ncbi:MAG: DUF924 family protein [Pseudomonadota bacterium]
MVDAEDVVRFWCHECTPEQWYQQDDALDAEITRRFGPAVAAAQDGAFDDWTATAQGVLALLILIDQFARNIHRGTAQAFAGDARALAVARDAIARDLDQAIPMPERQFLFLPFMHSETLADQDDGIALMQARLGEAGQKTVLHARAHREIIARYGRFPYRNAALGRETRPEDDAFKEAGGYGAILRALQSAD